MAARLPRVAEALSDSAGLDDRLSVLLGDGFEEVSGCVVLSAFAASGRRTSVAACHDEAGFEAFINHVHLEDVLPEKSPSDVEQQTMLFVGRLASELTRAYPAKEFVVIASIGDSATVRFHENRKAQKWLDDNLERYENEAVLVLHVTAVR